MIGLKNAVSGIKNLFSSERNFQIQFFLFLVTLFAGWFFNISQNEWVSILIISAIILSLEALNSSIEKLCDLYSNEQNDLIKWIKDVSAAAVLISSTIALIIGGVIFVPKVLSLIN